MRNAIAVVVGFVGVALSAWLGFWIMFVGGIAQIIDAVQVDPINGTDVALGCARVVFAGMATSVALFATSVLAIGISNERW